MILPATRRPEADPDAVRAAAGDGLRRPHLDPAAAAVAADPRHAWREEPDRRKRAYARRHGVDVADLAGERLDDALEAVIGAADFLPARWLALGAAVVEAVGRIRTAACLGTGFLVSPWLLMTNHHVLDSAATAAGSTVTFRFREDVDEELTGTVRLDLDPGRCFLTSPVEQLDLTLVAVAATADGRPPGETFGSIPARGATGKILLGQPVNVVQHPAGRPCEVAVRNNLLLAVDDDTTLTYGTDTEPGSSGSPVLSDAWELVALHHSGGPAGAGGFGNVGIRTSAIVAHVRQAVAVTAGGEGPSGTDAPALLQELLDLGDAP